MSNESSKSPSPAWTRRLIVSIVIGSAAAAVAANVALQERGAREAAGERVPAELSTAGAAPVIPGHARRVQWRDPWKRGVPQPDPSVPSADKALADVADPAGELAAPTF